MSEAWPNPDPDPGPPLWPEWVEPPPDPDLFPPPGEANPTPDPISETGVTTPWPLREGDVFGTYEEDNPRVHSGEVSSEEAAWVSLIQEQVGDVVTGFYDADTASAVLAWRANHGVSVDDGDKWVDEVAWTQMMRFEKDSETEGLVDPTVLPGLMTWLDFADDSVFTLSGNKVQQVRDKSGGGFHATADPGMEPTRVPDRLDGKPVLKFVAAATQFLRLADAGYAAAPALEAFVLVRVEVDPPLIAANIGLWCIQSVANNVNYPATTGIIWDALGSTTRKTTVNPSQDLTLWNVYSASSAPGEWSNYLNHSLLYATTVNVVGVNPALGFTLGKSSTTFYTDGEIAEFFIFNRKLTDDERTSCVDYLLSKWGIIQ